MDTDKSNKSNNLLGNLHAGSIGVTGHLASFFNYSDGMIVYES